jgi:hypothetical protein
MKRFFNDFLFPVSEWPVVDMFVVTDYCSALFHILLLWPVNLKKKVSHGCRGFQPRFIFNGFKISGYKLRVFGRLFCETQVVSTIFHHWS